MKKFLIVTLLLVVTARAQSQTATWGNVDGSNPNRAQLSVGYDYGLTTQLGYARLVSLYRPVLLGLDISLPMGSTVFDDFKVRLGGEVQVLEQNGFGLSVRISSNFRRFQNLFVRSVGFGADFTAIAGYYTDTWHAAGEFGFDKAISTNLAHSDLMRSNFPEIRDGWYVPTGGHFYYGIQSGVALGKQLDLSLRLGSTRSQLSDQNPALPYYAQLGLGMAF